MILHADTLDLAWLSSLAQTLSNLANNSGDAAKLPTVPFPSRDPKKMQQILDETLGFAHR